MSYDEFYSETESRLTAERLFDAVDANGDGEVSMLEWIANPIMVSTEATDTVIRERFGYYDVDGSASLRFVEIYGTNRAKKIAFEEFRGLWPQMDYSGDGVLDNDEITTALEQLTGQTWSDLALDGFISTFDKNGDGQVNMIEMWLVQSQLWDQEKEEYSTRVLSEREFWPIWVAFDPDLDGYCSFDDFVAAFGDDS